MAEIITLEEAHARGVLPGGSCAFGVFDGFHRGHRFLVDQAIATAWADGAASVALTFDVDPDELFRPAELVKLMPNDTRLRTLAASGVDYVVVLAFTREFAGHAPERFLEESFGACPPAHVHVGEGFRYGCRAAGTTSDLSAWLARRGAQLHVHDLVQIDGAPVSATRIRRLIGAGDALEARCLLGRSSAGLVLA